MDSSQSSLPNADSHSEPNSAPSAQESSPPQLETLISHLVAAKRSLSSIYHVSRANEIVNSARAALEEAVVVSAKTGFLRRSLKIQIRILYNVRSEVESISHRGRLEFETALKELDAADERIQRTLDKLRTTVVHSSFRPEGEEPKTLHDFVDERGLEELQSNLKGAIDRTNEAQAQLNASSRAFDAELESLQDALGRYRTTMESVSSRSSLSASSQAASNALVSTPSAIPGLLRSLESHAQEMADLLESLVHHFDRCVTAVKHTEGGGAVARSIAGDMPAGLDVHVGNPPESADENNTQENPDPMTDSDYQELVSVLTKDAAEAEDVVLEIQERSSAMEAILETVLAHRDALIEMYRATTNVFDHLSTLSSTRLPEFIAQAHTFTQIWNEERNRIRQGMMDLSDLRSLYVGFLDAYDGLILEVARRKHVRQGVERILRDTQAKLDQLYEEDVNAREAFRVEQGDYLPSDIWPGLSRGPMRIKFIKVPGDRLDTAVKERQDGKAEGSSVAVIEENTVDEDYIPDIPKEVVNDAIARLKARAKGGSI